MKIRIIQLIKFLTLAILPFAAACTTIKDLADFSDFELFWPAEEEEFGLAFPGATGFGRFTSGGRGGTVYTVTTLADDGPGSLREAIEARGTRTIVFAVDGIIELEAPLSIDIGQVSIAGHSAPGDGITLANHGLIINATEVIVRYLRVRPGDKEREETDAISIVQGKNIIVDHCSASWSTDEAISVSPPRDAALRFIDNITVQWTLISESLNDSIHAKGPHGYGSLIRGSGGARYSFHNNLWAHHRARMPRPGNYVPIEDDPDGPLIDFRNNVFYNWGDFHSGYNADTDSRARYNFVANSYRSGPNSKLPIAFEESNPNARMYFADNFMNSRPEPDPTGILRLPDGYTLEAVAFDVGKVRTEPADDAYNAVLADVGASLSRDPVDQRVIESVIAGRGTIIDSQDEVGGWPAHRRGAAAIDQDGDGMSDAWEVDRGLDPTDKSDGALDPDGNGYTSLEEFLNGLLD